MVDILAEEARESWCSGGVVVVLLCWCLSFDDELR